MSAPIGTGHRRSVTAIDRRTFEPGVPGLDTCERYIGIRARLRSSSPDFVSWRGPLFG